MGCPLLMFWELFPFSKLILQQINFTHPGRQYILVLKVLFVCLFWGNDVTCPWTKRRNTGWSEASVLACLENPFAGYRWDGTLVGSGIAWILPSVTGDTWGHACRRSNRALSSFQYLKLLSVSAVEALVPKMAFWQPWPASEGDSSSVPSPSCSGSLKAGGSQEFYSRWCHRTVFFMWTLFFSC